MNMIRTNLYFPFICFPLRRLRLSHKHRSLFYSMRMKDRAHEARTHGVVSTGIQYLRSTFKIKWPCALDKARD